MTLAMTLEALLADRTEPAAFASIHKGFKDFPSEEGESLKLLFGGCLRICELAQNYEVEGAESLSADLFEAWQQHKKSSTN